MLCLTGDSWKEAAGEGLIKDQRLKFLRYFGDVIGAKHGRDTQWEVMHAV